MSLTSTTNNPRSTWLQYFGLPDDLDEYTLSDVTAAVSSYVLPTTTASAEADPTREERTIALADFSDYLQRVGEPYRFLVANRPHPPDAAASSSSSTGTGAGAAAAEASEAARQADLSSVPEVCFAADFDLSRPETFAYFSPPGQQVAASMVTLEKLAGYLDTVELTLLSEVSSRSESFFSAFETYERLRSEVAAGCEQIDKLRSKMRALEANLVDKSLRLPTLVRRRANTAALLEKLRLVHAVWATQPTIQQLLTARDFPGALELISSSQQLLSTELAGVQSLRKLGTELTETKRRITQLMSRDLLQLCLGYDLDGGAPSMPSEALASELDHRIVPLACGLMRLRLLHEAVQELEEIMLRDVRALFKRRLADLLASLAELGQEAEAPAAAPSSEAASAAATADDANGAAAAAPKRTAMARVRELSQGDFEGIVAGVATPLLVQLRRAATVHAALVKALATPLGKQAAAAAAGLAPSTGVGAGAGAESEDGREYVAVVESHSAELLSRVCEAAHDRYARMLKSRRDAHARMRLVDFVRMNGSIQEFVRDVAYLCPQLTSSSGTAAEMQQQANDFLNVHHEESTRKLEALVELEQWKQVDVAPEFQGIADAFARNAVPQLAESELLRLREAEPAEGASAAREVLIDGVGYKCVSSSLLLLTMAAHYTQCVASLQTVGAAVAQKLPALLSLFHRLTYKQVLMAGAMRPESAALKSIAFRHLALASQSLGLVLALLPHLKAILAAYVPDAQRNLLMEVDAAQADYEKHQQELFSKFVSILEDRRRRIIGGEQRASDGTTVPTLSASLKPSEQRRKPEPTQNVKLVAKDIMQMHKQLQPLLSRTQLHTVFVQVLGAFDEGLLEAYRAVDASAVMTRQCIVADVLFLRTEVSKLHLTLPQGVCPELTGFAKKLDVSS